MASPPGAAAAYTASQETSPGYSNQSAEFFLSNYRLGKTLGIGSFGKVKVAEHVLTGHKVAIKILNRKKIKQMDMEEKVRREIKILRLFMHPHIIRLYEVIETPTDIYVVMEYVKSGELFDYIVEKGRLMEDEARHFFQQIISGVEYCHRNMIVHRDLKPENLLLDSKMNVKIADFGLSNVMRDGHFLKTSCGSPNYAAPEVISGRLYAGPEVDVWSCGVILYALLCGSLPFDDENIPNLFKKIKGGIYTLPSHLSPGARDLIPRMLLVDPLKRVTIAEIRMHPWFTVRLPRYLALSQSDPLTAGAAPDEEVLREVLKLGFERNFVMQSLRGRQQNKATVAYHLLTDNRRHTQSSAYLKQEMTESEDTNNNSNNNSTHHHHAMSNSNSKSGNNLQLAPRLVVERRWRLGLTSRAHPSSIVTEMLRTLRHLGIAWKKCSPYNYKCRALVETFDVAEGEDGGGLVHGDGDDMMTDDQDTGSGGGGGGVMGGERHVKFELQLYRSREGEYVVDLQRLEGELFFFLDICGKVASMVQL
jgi:5'-AMP-activated protein kinase, catalytic alpha subunit